MHLTVFAFLFFLSFSSISSSSEAQHYVKLPLFYKLPIPTARQALAFDSFRLSYLSSFSSSSASAAAPPPSTALSAPVISGASSGAGQYFVDFRLGNPPQRLRLVADTGSDLVWARCSACRDDCAQHHPPGTAFLPRHSSSFRPFHCYHPACHLVPHPASAPPCRRTRLHSPCRYRYTYADRSSSAGFFSRETATLNTSSSFSGCPYRLPSLPFGCAFNVSAATARGVLGLGRGPISFPSHAARRLGGGDAFSYCLADYTLSPPPMSFLLVGDLAAARTSATKNLTFTPILTNPLSPTFYYVRILGVSVDGRTLPVDPSVWVLDRSTGAGGTVVDSGTTLSFVPGPAYREIVLTMAARLPKAALAKGPPGFDLCVNESAEGVHVPRLAFQLRGGAELAPPLGNYFIDAAEGVRCLAIQPVSRSTGPGFGVIGNLMQQGFLMVFDRNASRIGFSWTGCAAN